MKDRLYFISDGQTRIDFEIGVEADHVVVTALFHPAADQDVTACDSTEEAAGVMHDHVERHFGYHHARLTVIRYRDDLRLMGIADLGRFAVPIVPLAQPEPSA
jgi:hypothetical protein